MPRTTVRTTRSAGQFDIWDNFERHERELRELGASDAQIARLREAAAAVEQAAGAAPLDALAPRACANGWIVAPPTYAAIRWASTCMLAATGGREPETGLAVLQSLSITLWALKSWGEGDKRGVMLAATLPDRLADTLAHIVPECEHAGIEALARDVACLMGGGDGKTSDPEKKTFQETLTGYYARRQQIASALIPPSSAPGSRAGERSDSPGTSSTTAAPPSSCGPSATTPPPPVPTTMPGESES